MQLNVSIKFNIYCSATKCIKCLLRAYISDKFVRPVMVANCFFGNISHSSMTKVSVHLLNISLRHDLLGMIICSHLQNSPTFKTTLPKA